MKLVIVEASPRVGTSAEGGHDSLLDSTCVVYADRLATSRFHSSRYSHAFMLFVIAYCNFTLNIIIEDYLFHAGWSASIDILSHCLVSLFFCSCEMFEDTDGDVRELRTICGNGATNGNERLLLSSALLSISTVLVSTCIIL